jgi:hypothetical protein
LRRWGRELKPPDGQDNGYDGRANDQQDCLRQAESILQGDNDDECVDDHGCRDQPSTRVAQMTLAEPTHVAGVPCWVWSESR